MRSPTSSTPSMTPSARRLVTAVGVGTKRQAERWSHDDPVDLLGHRPVERPKPRLDVGDGDRQLRRRERSGQRGVRVAVDEHRIRPLAPEDGFDAGQHATGLLRR